MDACITITLFILLAAGSAISGTTTSTNVTYVFPDNTCYLSSKPRHTNTSQMFIFEYNGRSISDDCQTVSMHSADASLDKYKFCITPVSFIDPNCSVTVEFTYSEYVMVFNCNTTEKDMFCTNEETELTVKAMVVSEGYKNSNFTITIRNEIAELHMEQFVTDSGTIAGIAVGCTLGVIVVILVCCIYLRGRKSSNEYAYHSSNS